MNPKMRANAFAAFGALSNYGIGAQHEAFLEQVSYSFWSHEELTLFSFLRTVPFFFDDLWMVNVSIDII